MDKPVEVAKKTLYYQATATPTDMLRHVNLLRETDMEAETQQGWGCGIAAVGAAIGLLSFVVGIITESLGALNVAGIGIGVVACIGGLIYRSVAGKLNLVDRRYELLAATVDMLRRDMPQDGTLNAKVGFRSPTDGQFLKEKGKIGPWDVSFYEDPWFSLQGRLLDGTSFLLELTELTQQRGRWKRSRSGKSKYKSKTKSAFTANLRLKAKPEKYPNLESFSTQLPATVALPDWCTMKQGAVTANSLQLKIGAKPPEPWDVPKETGMTKKNKAIRFNGAQAIAMMFLSLYRILNLCKGQGATQ